MDFVEWCGLVLKKLVEASQASPDIRMMGMDPFHLAAIIFGEEVVYAPEFWGATRHRAVINALQDLQSVDLVEHKRHSNSWKVAKLGRDLVNDLTPLWQKLCSISLEPQQEELLRVVNRLSPQLGQDGEHVWLEEINHERVLTELAWEEGMELLVAVSQELKQLGLIRPDMTMGPHIDFQATYPGLVWETRRGFTLEAQVIDSLVAEWETTSVDFKRELHLHTASEKAEFIKDMLGLATTQASGRRWMIIGFDDKTRTYYGPPDPKVTENRIQQLMAEYTTPYLDVRYEVVDYRGRQVGKIEVLRDRRKIPYQVAKSLGSKEERDKKRIEQGQIFVRHGSQTEAPTEHERLALQEEGDRARAISQSEAASND